MNKLTWKLSCYILLAVTSGSLAAELKQQNPTVTLVEQKQVNSGNSQNAVLMQKESSIGQPQSFTYQQDPGTVQSISMVKSGSSSGSGGAQISSSGTLVQQPQTLNVASAASKTQEQRLYHAKNDFDQGKIQLHPFLVPVGSLGQANLAQQRNNVLSYAVNQDYQPHSLYGFQVGSIAQTAPISGQTMQVSQAVPVSSKMTISQAAPSSQTYLLTQGGQQPQQASIQTITTTEQKPMTFSVPVNQMSRTVEFRTVPNQQIESKPQIVEISPTSNSPQPIQFMKSQEPVTRIVQEISKPVVQEYREIIQPATFQQQFVQPVQEKAHSVVSKFEGKSGGSQQLFQIQRTQEQPLVLFQNTAQAVPIEKEATMQQTPVEKKYFFQSMQPAQIERQVLVQNVQPAPVEKQVLIQNVQPAQVEKKFLIQSSQPAQIERQILIQNAQPAPVEKQIQIQQAQPQQIQMQSVQPSVIQMVEQRRPETVQLMLRQQPQPRQLSMINLQRPEGQMVIQGLQQSGQQLFLELINANANQGQLQFKDKSKGVPAGFELVSIRNENLNRNNLLSGQQQIELSPSQFQMAPVSLDNRQSSLSLQDSAFGQEGQGLVGGYQTIVRGQPLSLSPGSAIHGRPATTITIEATPENLAQLNTMNTMAFSGGNLQPQIYSDRFSINKVRRSVKPNDFPKKPIKK